MRRGNTNLPFHTGLGGNGGIGLEIVRVFLGKLL